MIHKNKMHRFFAEVPVLGEQEIFVNSLEEAEQFVKNMLPNQGHIKLIVRTFETTKEETVLVNTGVQDE